MITVIGSIGVPYMYICVCAYILVYTYIAVYVIGIIDYMKRVLKVKSLALSSVQSLPTVTLAAVELLPTAIFPGQI